MLQEEIIPNLPIRQCDKYSENAIMNTNTQTKQRNILKFIIVCVITHQRKVLDPSKRLGILTHNFFHAVK